MTIQADRCRAGPCALNSACQSAGRSKSKLGWKINMQINFVYNGSVAIAPAGFKQGLAIAASIIDGIVLDPITVTLDIGFGEDNGSSLASGTLGEAQPAFGVLMSYSELVASLTTA